MREALLGGFADSTVFRQHRRRMIGSIRIARACFVSAANEDENEVRLHLAETVRQHDLIFDAIKGHDAERADEYATLHHDLTKQRIKRILFAGAPVLNGKLDLAVEWNLP